MDSPTPPLLGRVAIASLFLGQDGHRWSELEEARCLASLLGAAEWVERQARLWGARVNLPLLSVYFALEDRDRRPEAVEIGVVSQDHDSGLSEARAEARIVAAIGRGLQDLGFHDLGEFLDRVGSRVEADSVVWVVHMRAAGRSFVISEGEVGIRGANLAVCFAREDDFPGRLRGKPRHDPATFAHELLHLFGASDKYGAPLSAFPPGSVTRDEIMRLDRERLTSLRVDPLTAREIGWPAETKPPASTREVEAGGE